VVIWYKKNAKYSEIDQTPEELLEGAIDEDDEEYASQDEEGSEEESDED
jgi:hypothetical protein